MDVLSPERAAEHVLHAIAEARTDLLTEGIMRKVGWFNGIAQSEVAPAHWEWNGFVFAQSGAVAVLGAAAVVTAPLEIPTLLFGGAAFAATHGMARLADAPTEARRMDEATQFRDQYSISPSSLRWSLAPPAALFWYLAEGDTVLELVLKAKRGLLGLGENAEKCSRLLTKLLGIMPGSAEERSERLEAAVCKAEADMAPIGASMSSSVAAARAMLHQQRLREAHEEIREQEQRAHRADEAGAAPIVAGSDEDSAHCLVLTSDTIEPSEGDDWEMLSASAPPEHEVVCAHLAPADRGVRSSPVAPPLSLPTTARSDGGSIERNCTVCMARKRTHAITPCGHRCLCARCADLTALDYTCPICRSTAQGLLRVYDP